MLRHLDPRSLPLLSPIPLLFLAAAGTANGRFLTAAVGFYCCRASIGLLCHIYIPLTASAPASCHTVCFHQSPGTIREDSTFSRNGRCLLFDKVNLSLAWQTYWEENNPCHDYASSMKWRYFHLVVSIYSGQFCALMPSDKGRYNIKGKLCREPSPASQTLLLCPLLWQASFPMAAESCRRPLRLQLFFCCCCYLAEALHLASCCLAYIRKILLLNRPQLMAGWRSRSRDLLAGGTPQVPNETWESAARGKRAEEPVLLAFLVRS